ncbi:Si-specific NAD(P)(+) transhydrogenase [Balneolaceae bacterium YR4-1]|uniref:Soluble pyridine nucleotide transhydrogenase n=1 Tax=Halalkalibaculum roseum TaxID=2709311 RepID=A0A6M1T162_9BACT|nr:Si-specific NAD(P)(+) transhydrogenase [Halalkalibaculum roseum]NGP77304.1 Si-specific NAD(P)(+) transhydrogenase [Halalkalibaculum roseum]
MSRDYDVIIIGSGPAGFSCAMQSSKFDKRALVVESHEKYLGGTWINTGTVPSKALREAAKTILDFNSQFNKEDTQKPYDRFKMEDLLQYKDEILEKENLRAKNDLIKNEVDVVRGFGKIVDENTVEVETHIGTKQTYTAKYILICTGSSPVNPDKFEIDNDKILDYKSILNLTHIPRRLVIIGTGVNALEYATTFSALGTRITIIGEREEFLTFLDHEVKEHLHKILAEKNIRIHPGVTVEDVNFNPLNTTTEVRFRNKKGDKRLQVIETEHVLYLEGRKPNTDKIGLEKVGIETDERGFIHVNDSYKTEVDTVYAAGDVVGFPRLASASFSQGRLAACSMFGIPALETPDQIPYGIYTIPEISNIGINERDAREKGLDVTVGRAYFKNNAKADMTNQDEGLLKLVFDTETLKLLGVHIIGEQASNLIHLGQAVISYGGDVRYFIQHVMNYPTLSEAYKIAAFNGVNRVYKAGVKYKNILENNNSG